MLKTRLLDLDPNCVEVYCLTVEVWSPALTVATAEWVNKSKQEVNFDDSVVSCREHSATCFVCDVICLHIFVRLHVHAPSGVNVSWIEGF